MKSISEFHIIFCFVADYVIKNLSYILSGKVKISASKISFLAKSKYLLYHIRFKRSSYL